MNTLNKPKEATDLDSTPTQGENPSCVTDGPPLGTVSEFPASSSLKFRDDSPRTAWIDGDKENMALTCSPEGFLLEKERVPSLIAHLQSWLLTGSFALTPPDATQIDSGASLAADRHSDAPPTPEKPVVQPIEGSPEGPSNASGGIPLQGTDVVRDEEKLIEEMWQQQKGVRPDTGEAWLTPRMERNVKKTVQGWAKQDADPQPIQSDSAGLLEEFRELDEGLKDVVTSLLSGCNVNPCCTEINLLRNRLRKAISKLNA